MRAVDAVPRRGAAGASSTYKRTLYDDVACPQRGHSSDLRRAKFLQNFTNQPDLWRIPGTGRFFDELRMVHDGTFWTIELTGGT